MYLKGLLMGSNLNIFIFIIISMLTEVLTFHLFGNWLCKLQPVLKRREGEVKTCTLDPESLAAKLSVWGQIAQQLSMMTYNL